MYLLCPSRGTVLVAGDVIDKDRMDLHGVQHAVEPINLKFALHK